MNVENLTIYEKFIQPGSALVLQQCGNIKLTENGRIHKIFHVIDIEKLLDIDNLDEFLNR